jgi:hypothetical protein
MCWRFGEAYKEVYRSEFKTCMLATILREKVEEETRLRCHLEHLEELKNIEWRQRAHAWWLRKGDRKFVTRVTSIPLLWHKRRISVSRI